MCIDTSVLYFQGSFLCRESWNAGVCQNETAGRRCKLLFERTCSGTCNRGSYLLFKYLAKVKNNIEKIIRFEFWKAKNKTFYLFQEDRKLGLIPFFVSMDKPKNKNKIGSTYGCINPLILVFFYNKLSQQLNFLNCTINNYTFHHFPKIF